MLDDCACWFVLVYMYMLFIFVFFQAEDGIRDLVRSRGLGDVYKRQVCRDAFGDNGARPAGPRRGLQGRLQLFDQGGRDPVSYTHLTLPTSDLV